MPQGDLEVQVVVDDIDVTPQLDDMEEKRVLRVEAALTATATVREQVDEVLLRDAYAPGRVIDVSAGEVALLQQKERQSTQQTYRFALPLPDGLPPISRALMLSARPVVQEVSATDKGVRVSGVIACDVVYHSDEESMPIFGYHASEPFECDLGMSCDTTDAQLGALANVAQANCTAVSDEEVDCRVALDIEAYCTPVVTRDVVSEVTDGGEATGGADYGIVLVVVQHDDTLWSVARKFNATVDEVTQLNPYLKERELHPGDKVLMYRPFRPAKRA